jgi:hypothetical protein
MADLKSPQYGGGGGDPFDDSSFSGNAITRIVVRAAVYVDSIQVTYGNQQGPRHGGGGGEAHEINLAKGEQIIAVFGRSAQLVDQIGFVTLSANNELRQIGPYGGGGGDPFYIIGKVDAFFGRSAALLDAVGVYVAPPVLVSK